MENKLQQRIVNEIKKRGIVPRPKWQFLLKRSFGWTLAAVSLMLGSIVIATMMFIFSGYDESLAKYFSESIYIDILELLPFFWFCTLVLLVWISKYAVRQTTYGYRYTTGQILTGILSSSIVLGALLYSFGLGERVQNFLVHSSPYYDALTFTSKDAWSHPEKGLLGGVIISVGDSGEIELRDFSNQIWQVDVREIADKKIDFQLQKGVMIKIIGTQDAPFSFYAEEVFSWNNNI